MKKPKNNLNLGKVALVVVVVIGISMVVKGIGMQPIISANNQLADQLSAQIEDKKHSVEELDKTIENSDSDEYIEKIAREKLGMIKADEIVFIDISGQ